ncbi:MAG: roadblock/LC7 domain-containing protein, partial [Anaerolineae bacterium]
FPELEARAHLLQVYEYLTKPFSVDHLTERVQIALGDAVFPDETMERDQKTFEPPAEEIFDFSCVRHPEDASASEGKEAAAFWEPEPHDEVAPTVSEEPVQTILASAPVGREPLVSEGVEEREQPVFETIKTPPAREKVISTLSPHRFEALYNCLSDLRFEVGAQCVLLADISGELVAEAGVTMELDTATLVSLLAGGYASTFEMARQLGESRSFNLNFHEGERYDIYSSNVGDDFLLVILCDRQVGPSRVGVVWLYAKRSIEKLLDIMAQEEGIEAREALGEEFGTSLGNELDNMFGEESDNQPLSPEEGGLPLSFEEAKARGLVSDNIFLPSSDDSGEEKEATGGE